MCDILYYIYIYIYNINLTLYNVIYNLINHIHELSLYKDMYHVQRCDVAVVWSSVP